MKCFIEARYSFRNKRIPAASSKALHIISSLSPLNRRNPRLTLLSHSVHHQSGIVAGIGMAKGKSTRTTEAAAGQVQPKEVCGLCGKAGALTRTECCNRWICDDEQDYVLFSYARNSCSRNHRRYTLCGSHFAEEHEGSWQDCAACREGFETELYVWYGTNEYNFEKLDNPPRFRPTLCTGCRRRIRLGTDGYMVAAGKYWCEDCGSGTLRARPKGPKRGRRNA